MVADLLPDSARAVADEISAAGVTATHLACDVTDLDAVQALADATVRLFGTVNLVCNNAGVCKGGSIEATSPGDARWMFEVNVFGMYHGIHVFAPLLRQAAARGELAWPLNTGSENSLGIPPVGAVGIYNATKHTVLALSDNARQESAASGVGVSVLCPALVRTDLLDSQMHRHARWGGPKAMDAAMQERVAALMAAKGHDADETAAIALDGVQAGRRLPDRCARRSAALPSWRPVPHRAGGAGCGRRQGCRRCRPEHEPAEPHRQSEAALTSATAAGPLNVRPTDSVYRCILTPLDRCGSRRKTLHQGLDHRIGQAFPRGCAAVNRWPVPDQ